MRHVRQELALGRTGLFRTRAGLAQFFRLLLALANRVAQHAHRRAHVRAPPLGGARDERDIQAHSKNENDLCEKDGQPDRALVDVDDPRLHRAIAKRAERREVERPPERGLRLVRGTRQQQKEQPTLLCAGEVDRGGHQRHIGDQKKEAEIERQQTPVELTQTDPRHQAVDQRDRCDHQERRL